MPNQITEQAGMTDGTSAGEKYAAARAEADAVYLTEWRAAQDAPTLAEASEAAQAAERKRIDAWQAAAAQYRAGQVIGCEPAPLCPRNPEHGRLEYRAPGTPEQAFTHIAYRCPAGYPSYCSGSADWPTPQLIAWFEEEGHHEHAAQLRRAWQA